MAERIAVQQQERRSLAAMDGDDSRTTGFYLGFGEPFKEHRASLFFVIV
jgi:hypothetical protein